MVEWGVGMSDNYRIKVLKKPDVTDLAGEKVMIDFDSGKYYMLIGSANDIWDMLGDKADSDGIVGALTEIYEVEAEECRTSVLKFLNDLVTMEVISLEKCT